jgi:heat shock protein HslJ
MKNKGTWALTLLALASVVVAACGPVGGSAEKTIYVGPRQVDCVGVAPQKCLLVKENPDDDWSMYYDRIEGFDYEPGYEYELRIVEEEVENPPADASSIRWTLVEVVSKTRSLEGTIWVLESYLNSEGVLVGPLPDSQVTAVFQEGQIGGNASCNSYFGSYEVDADGNLSIGALGMTEMFCQIDELMAQESDYLAALGNAASYLIAGDNLQIEDADGKEILVFSALKPAPLAGTLWGFAGFVDANGTARSSVAGSEITATFDEEGNLSGSSGCNNYSTTYEVSGDQMTISGPIASTMMMCPAPGVMEQEAEYLAALETVSSYRIEAKQLTLFNAQGQAILNFAVQEPTLLVGTQWDVIGYNNGKGGVVSVAAGTELSALFGEDGTLAGSAGCNNYSAAYEVDDASAAEGEISIGPAASTRMMCPEPEGVMEQEALYLAALEMAEVFRIQGDRLQLRTAEGSLVADYRVKEQSAKLDPVMLANIEYKSDWTQSGMAPLTDGEYREQAAPGSATETVVTITEHIAHGQLDGQDAAAVVLVTDPGGSGTFYDLAVVVEQDGAPVNVASTMLGDRVQIKAVSIVGNEIIVEMVTHGPDDPMCCPTQDVVQTYVLEEQELVQTSG